MKIINDFKQQSDEWFAYKLGKFGASDGQALGANGKGLETLCFEKASERLTKTRARESYTNGDMERGNEMEALARDIVSLEYGHPIMECGLIEMNEHVICSPDGLVGDDGLIEIKCPSNRVFMEYLYNKKIDTKYYAQMQMQLLVSGRKWVDYCVYNAAFPVPLIIKRVERDKEAITKLEKGITEGIAKIEEILKTV